MSGAQVKNGDEVSIGTRTFTVKGVTRSGKVCLKSDDGVTTWSTIAEVTA